MSKPTKDFSLLRPAIGSAFLPAERYCTKGGVLIGFIGYTRTSGQGCFRYITGDYAGNYDLFPFDNVYYAPLFWLGGRPIYRGDMLCSPHRGPFMVGDISAPFQGNVCPLGEPSNWIPIDTVSYLPPPVLVERWIIVRAGCEKIERYDDKDKAEAVRTLVPFPPVVGIFPITEPE